MSGINKPFPVDSNLLGGVVGPIFNPSQHPPNCFTQGIVKKDGTLDPSVPSQVVKFEQARDADAEFSVFALHGNFSAVSGVMSSHAHPATALSATVSSEGHISKAVFGTIEPVTKSNIRIHALAGIHATFGMLSKKEPARWGCTKVHIADTYWLPWIGCMKVSDILNDSLSPTPDASESRPFFCCDFENDQTFVQFRTYSREIFSGDRFSTNMTFGCTTQIVLMPNGTITQRNVQGGGSGQPSVEAVARGKKMLLECNQLLQSKMAAIQWLEHCTVDRQTIFACMDGFQRAMQPRPGPSIFGVGLMPAMRQTVFERLLHDPSPVSRPSVISRFVKPCKCTPTHKDPLCANPFCRFKLPSSTPSILAQLVNREPVLARFETAAAEANAKAAAAEAEAQAKAAAAEAAAQAKAAAAEAKAAAAEAKAKAKAEAVSERGTRRASAASVAAPVAAPVVAASKRSKRASDAVEMPANARASVRSSRASAAPVAAPVAVASERRKRASSEALETPASRKRKTSGGSKSKSKRRFHK